MARYLVERKMSSWHGAQLSAGCLHGMVLILTQDVVMACCSVKHTCLHGVMLS
jgi:hypothetical protein